MRSNDVPYHELFDHGYASIGCAPCTRPIQPGESERAGRWWWESETDKECGIHCSVGIAGVEDRCPAGGGGTGGVGLSGAAEASGLSAAGDASDGGQTDAAATEEAAG